MLKPDKEKERDYELKRWAYHLDEAGKRKWAQQRRSIDQLLGRMIESPEPLELEAPGTRPIDISSDKAPIRPVSVSDLYKVDE